MNQEAVLILGATSDIGKAIAHEFAKKGHPVYLAARNTEQIKADASDLEIRYGVKTATLHFDLTETASHANMLEKLPSEPGIIVAVAAYMGEQKKAETDFKEASMVMQTNYNGWVSVLHPFAAKMEENQRGIIIGISSVAGERGRKSNYVYGSAKAAFSAFLSGLRHRLYKKGVHVLTVKPGFVDTKMTKGLDLPPLLTASPQKVAQDTLKAAYSKKNILYTKWMWRYIMLIIRNVPESIFKKTNL